MKMIEALEDIKKEHPEYQKERVEEVLNAIFSFQLHPDALHITGFDPEKCQIEESYSFLKTNQDMLALCCEQLGTVISSDTVESAFNNAHVRSLKK